METTGLYAVLGFALPNLDLGIVFNTVLDNLPTVIWVLLVPILLYRNAQGRELFLGLFDDTSFFAGFRAAVLILMFHFLALAIFFVPIALFWWKDAADFERLRPLTSQGPYVATLACTLPLILYGLAMVLVQYKRDPRPWKIPAIIAPIALGAGLSFFMIERWTFSFPVLVALTAANMGLCALLIFLVHLSEKNIKPSLRRNIFWNYFAIGLCMCLQIALIAGEIKTLDMMYKTGGEMLRQYNMYYLLLLALIVGSILFLTLASNLQYISPTFTLMSICIFYLMLGDLAVAALILLDKTGKIILTAVLAFAVYIIFIRKWKMHSITLVDSPLLSGRRQHLKDFFKAWWETNVAPDIEKDGDVSIYLLGAQGGGSRAGYWVSKILNMNRDVLRKRLFAATSASGGSSGIGATLALWRYLDEHPDIPEEKRHNLLQRFPRGMYERNYLSGSFLQLMVNETLKRFKTLLTSKNVYNRNYHHQMDEALGFAEALKKGWNPDYYNQNVFKLAVIRIKSLFMKGDRPTLDAGAAGKIPNYLFMPYLSYWYKGDGAIDARLPLYFPITSHIQSGRAGFASPVQMETEPGVFIDSIDIVKESENGYRKNRQSISMVGASQMSQLFPLLNAYTYLPDCGNFIDGGLFENQGLTLLSRLQAWLEQAVQEADFIPEDVKKRVKVKTLFSLNDQLVPNHPEPLKGTKPISQLTAITRAAGFAGIAGRTTWWNAYYKQALDPGRLEEFVLQDKDTPESERVPLGRWLSTRSMDKMDDRMAQEIAQPGLI